jgi:hypothetical protein
VSRPETATLSSGTVATIAAAARAVYLYDASLGDVYARANKQLGQAAGEDFAARGTIAGAVMVVARGQRRGLR